MKRCFSYRKLSIPLLVLVNSASVWASPASTYPSKPLSSSTYLRSNIPNYNEVVDYSGYGVNFAPQCYYTRQQITNAFNIINRNHYSTLQIMGDFPQVDSASGVCLKNNSGVTTTGQQTSLLNNLLNNTTGIKNVSWVIYSPFDMETAGVNGKNIDASESDIDGNIYNWMTLNGLTRLCQKGDGDAKNCEVVMGNEQFFVPVEEHKTSHGVKAIPLPISHDVVN